MRPEDSFLDDVKDAKPPVWPRADEWADSERGRRVLERVLAADGASGAPGRARQRRGALWAGSRLVFTAGGIAVVALAVTLAFVLAGQGGRQGAVTQSTVPAVEQVSGATAVADLMPLYRLKSSNDLTPAGNDASAQMEQAVAQGLVTREEASGAWASGPMTQGAYAVLLVKAFASFLPQGAFPEQQIDPRATPAEGQAIAALMTSGVILSQDGRFVAGQTLTKDVESRLLGRVQNIYKRVMGE